MKRSNYEDLRVRSQMYGCGAPGSLEAEESSIYVVFSMVSTLFGNITGISNL